MHSRNTQNAIYRVLRSAGAPLDESVRQELEPLFGRSFANVRVHRDIEVAISAERLGARAYTVGNHIVFGAGEYDPKSRRGLRLIAHELAHVFQQSGAMLPNVLRIAEAASPFEAEADHVADDVMRGVAAPPIHPGLAVALVQRDGCPGPPEWVRISAAKKLIWEPANAAIEMAYLKAHSSRESAILVGSQYEKGGWRDIKLPKGAPNKAFNDALLAELRGLEKQRQPDVVDFHTRAFYEIKSDEWVAANPGKGEEQLKSLYKTTEAIQAKYGGGLPWKADNVDWRPPVVLPFPGTANMIVCTAATDYDKTMRGLIQYHVRLNVKKKEEEEKRIPKAIKVRSFDQDFVDVVPEQQKVRRKLRNWFDPYFPEFVIIAPYPFHESWKKQVNAERHERQLDVMRVDLPPFLDHRHPIGQFRRLGWTIIGLTALMYAGALFVVIAAETFAAGGVVAAGSAGGGASAGGAEIISLAAYKALHASKAAKTLAAAAGVLLVVGTPGNASAKETAISDVGAVRVVPVEYFKPFFGLQVATTNNDVPVDFMHTPETMAGQFNLGASVLFDWLPHRVIGQFAVEY